MGHLLDNFTGVGWVLLGCGTDAVELSAASVIGCSQRAPLSDARFTIIVLNQGF
jgi:hypothetical protein